MGSNKAPTFFIWKEEILISIIFTMVRMFHDENKYFITESSDWIEQEENIKLFDYLDALKYMPQMRFANYLRMRMATLCI